MKILGIDISRERKPKPGDETYYGKLPNGGTKVKYTNKPLPTYIRLSEKEPPKPKSATSEEIWCVKWNQRYGRGRDDYKLVTQLFISEAEAKKFERSLKHANELLGHTSDELTWTKCEKIKDNRL